MSKFKDILVDFDIRHEDAAYAYWLDTALENSNEKELALRLIEHAHFAAEDTEKPFHLRLRSFEARFLHDFIERSTMLHKDEGKVKHPAAGKEASHVAIQRDYLEMLGEDLSHAEMYEQLAAKYEIAEVSTIQKIIRKIEYGS